MKDQATWTEADFDEMSWHDCQIKCISLDQDGQWQSDLVFHLDFITEWLCGKDKTCNFKVAPVVLRFTNVDNLALNVSLGFKQPLEISSVSRRALQTTGYSNFHWVILIQGYPEQEDNVIEFNATGFTQELIGHPIETTHQVLTDAQRTESKAEWRTSKPTVP